MGAAMKRWGILFGVVLAIVLGAMAPAAGAAGRSGAPPRPLTHTHPLMGSDAQSLNWSGYDVTGGPFTSVTATWTQPAVRSSGSTFSDAAFWVGLDGDGSATVEQIGTEGFSEGVVGYDAWYEMYPAGPVTIGMAIHPGDVLTGTVTATGSATFTLSLVNHTTGKSFTTTQSMMTPAPLASAEIIAEAPSGGSGVVALADFTLASFTGCAIDGQPIGTLDWNRIDMIDEVGSFKDRTLPLGADAASFEVSTDVLPPFTLVTGARPGWHRTAEHLTFDATDVGMGVATTEYSLDGGTTWTPWATGSTLTIGAPAGGSNDGAHAVHVRSTDKAGNVEPEQIVRVRIDTQAPVVRASAASVVRGRLATLRYRLDDPRPGSPTATVTIRVTDRHGKVVRRAVLLETTVDATHAYRFLCKLAKGRYIWTAAAKDAAGNPAARAAATLVVK
jgi:hypothetical protein